MVTGIVTVPAVSFTKVKFEAEAVDTAPNAQFKVVEPSQFSSTSLKHCSAAPGLTDADASLQSADKGAYPEGSEQADVVVPATP